MTPGQRLTWYRHRIQNRLEKPLRTLAARWARWQLERRGLLKLLANRPSTAYPPDPVDLWFLYRQVRSRKPHCVLEFGAGCSTVILAQALYENGAGGKLYTVDAVPQWADITARCLPRHLQSVASVTASDMKSVQVDDGAERVLCHEHVPTVDPDFVYLDGPDFQDFEGKFDVPAAADLIDLEPKFGKKIYVVIDGRVKNTEFLKQHLKGAYRQRRNWPFEYWRTHILERERTVH
jgi:cephalosporin hydroxylase